MHGRETIVRYLQDTEAAERNFEDALSSLSKMGDQQPVQNALANMSRIARTQHERLEGRLKDLGRGYIERQERAGARVGFAPTIAQVGQSAAEKNTQHLILVVAAAAAETGMYEALATAANAADDSATERLARELQGEEREDYKTAAGLLRQSAVDSLQRTDDTARKSINEYLEDAIAAEKSFEKQLRDFAEEGSGDQSHALFLQHAEETRIQHERLTARLKELGGDPSAAKSFMAHLVGLSPKLAQLGHDVMDRLTQNLIIAFAVENCEVAMYESLIAVAESAGDTATAQLARLVQSQEIATAEKVWQRLAPTALSAFNKMAAAEQVATH